MNLELTGQTVDEVVPGYMLQLRTDDGTVLAIESTLHLWMPGHPEAVLESDDEYGKDPRLESLQGRHIAEASLASDGGLAVSFTDGTRFTVDPDEDYEAWNIVYPDGRRIVVMAGGELATWGADAGDE